MGDIEIVKVIHVIVKVVPVKLDMYMTVDHH